MEILQLRRIASLKAFLFLVSFSLLINIQNNIFLQVCMDCLSDFIVGLVDCIIKYLK